MQLKNGFKNGINPSHSGGEDQEDSDFKPAQAKSYADPISTNKWMWWYTSGSQLHGRVVAQGEIMKNN
jgi:hypothetical protein